MPGENEPQKPQTPTISLLVQGKSSWPVKKKKLASRQVDIHISVKVAILTLIF